jgi:hypothetical protein
VGGRKAQQVNRHELDIYNALIKSEVTILRNGWPDLLCKCGSFVFGVEIKKVNQKLSREQTLVTSLCKDDLGFIIFIVRSAEDAEILITAIRNKGYDKREWQKYEPVVPQWRKELMKTVYAGITKGKMDEMSKQRFTLPNPQPIYAFSTSMAGWSVIPINDY